MPAPISLPHAAREHFPGMHSSDRTTNAALAEKYDAVAYQGQSNALSHPDRMAVVATLYGLAPPSVATCRVLEFGCSDGANLLPMAASLPDGQFVGCDLSPRAIAAARQAAAELGLANVTFVTGDLSELPEARRLLVGSGERARRDVCPGRTEAQAERGHVRQL